MNTSIVIALPKIEDAKKIRTVLNRYGFTVAAVCNSGANALASISELDGAFCFAVIIFRICTTVIFWTICRIILKLLLMASGDDQ